MRNLIVLLAFAGSVVACETQGVVDSRYEGADGSHLSLRQFRNERRFYYSLSASLPSHDCGAREVRVVAMGQGAHVRLRVERAAVDPACET
jgi:hypothetical protein